MKRFILKIVFFVLFFCNVFAYEDNFEYQSKSLYIAYFWVKEFITFFSYHHFFMNHETTDNTYIACNNCQGSIGFYRTFGYFTAKGDEVVITELKRLAYHGTALELAQFLEKIYTDYQMICYQCDNQYHGWSIVNY